MSETEQECFKTLQIINPTDWVNIPDPLRRALFCLKDCIAHLQEQIVDTNKSIDLNAKGISKRLEFFEENSNFLKVMIETADSNSKTRINEVNENLLSEMLLFKKNLAQDLDFKQKSNDKKISIMEESLFTIKRVVQCLMTPNEVEEKIKIAVKEAKDTVKSEINDFIIVPENRQIYAKIGNIEQNLDNIRVNAEVNAEKLRKTVEKTEEELGEKVKSIENSLSVITDLRAKDTRTLENFYKTLKTEIAANDSQSTKKLAVLNINLEKMQKVSVEFNKKQIELKENIKKVEDDLQAYKHEIEEKLAQKPKKKSHKKKKKGKIESAIESEKSEYKVADSPSKSKNYKDSSRESPSNTPKVVESIPIPNSSLQKSYHKSKDSSASSKQSLHKSPSPHDSRNSPSPSTKKSVFCKSPENFGFDFSQLDQLTQSNPPRQISPLAKLPDMQVIDEKISKMLSEHVNILEKSIQSNKTEYESNLKEIKEKLSWFPMNVNEVKGKNLNEARIFTIEARLRLEENARVEQYNQIVTLINQLKCELTGFSPVSNLPYIGQGRSSVRHERRLSSEGFSEYIRNLPDSEGKIHFSAFAPKPLKTFNKYSKIP